MRRKSLLLGLTLAVAAAGDQGAPVYAQPGYQFGQNKVQYKHFDWAIFQTAHFEVYYYSEEKQAALDAARMAERGFEYLSDVLEHKIAGRTPLILYASLNDFQQTNVVESLLGDGTRGVTESRKNRVTLPITGSYREFQHVLLHELVHAFQFDIISTQKPALNGGSFNPPLWFIEGMAEYLSVGMDDITRMWVRDGLLNDDLLSVEKLGSTADIRVYRLGESVWAYIGQTYGKKAAGHLLKAAVRLGDIERAFKGELKLSFAQLTEDWHRSVRAQLLGAGAHLQRPEEVAQQLTKKASYFHNMNLVPAVSPDGRQIAFVSNRNLNEEIFLLTRQADGRFEERRLVKGGSSADFESLRFFETSLSWSRDGTMIAFVSKSGKDDAIYLISPQDGGILEKLVFEQMNGLVSPAIAPDGQRIAFVGIKGGHSDLYVYDLRTNALRRLTNDIFAELQPQWSPDGNSLAFVTDRGPGTDLERLFFGDYDLAVIDVASRRIEMLTDVQGNVTSPQWSPDGAEIAFVAAYQGIPNIYLLQRASGRLFPVTRLHTGVAGITESTPSMSWSADGRVMVFSSFTHGGWQLYRMEFPPAPPYSVFNSRQIPATYFSDRSAATNGAALSPDAVPPDSIWLPLPRDYNEMLAGYELAAQDSVAPRSYSTRPRLDAVSLGGSFGGVLGSVGGAQLLLSDMLGNHQFVIAAGLRTALLRSDLGLAYVNRSRRLNYGLEMFQQQDAYGALVSFNALGFVTQRYRGLNVFAHYPFSRFARIEASAGLVAVSQRFVVDTYLSGSRQRQDFDLGSAGIGLTGVALVFDTTLPGFVGPRTGHRSRVSLDLALGDFHNTTLLTDYRRYLPVGTRSVLAYRFLSGISTGRDAQVFQIGGPSTYRGSDYGAILGTRFLVQNIEYRYPLLPFLPPPSDFLSGVAFIDAAAGWGLEVPGLIKEKFQPFSTVGGLHLHDLQAALGVGARLNLGYLALRYDMAWPTNLRRFGEAMKQFSIGIDF